MTETDLMALVRSAAEKASLGRGQEREFLGMSLSRLDTLARFSAQHEVRELLAQPRYDNPKRLERYGFKAYSQNDEDGIIQEIFRRIGTTSRTFFEFGAGNGLEINCCYLLLQGWSGAWADTEEQYLSQVRTMFMPWIASGKLTVSRGAITAENINEVMQTLKLPAELDLLSIDVDGNDYYIFEALTARPRVVIIEYNAELRPPVRLVQKPTDRWDDTSYSGASLAALTALAKLKDYVLVGTNLPGVNAFFVRDDCAEGKFADDATAENHYHPPRYKLGEFGFPTGHMLGVGEYVVLP